MRTFVALGVVIATMAVAPAGWADKLPVRIDSRPSGATLYLDSRDSDPIGRTPFRGALDEGTYTLIAELEGHEASVQTIRVKRKKGNRPLLFSAELEKLRSATLEITALKGGGAKGARVLIDGVEQGNVPDQITVPAGPHQVEVLKDGYKTFEVWVEPSEGESLPIEVALELGGSSKKGGGKVAARGGGDEGDEGDEGDGGDEGDEGDEGGEGDEGDEGGGDVDTDVEIEPSRRRTPFVIASLGLELGGRSFTYVNPVTANLRDYSAAGIPMARLAVELYPLASLGVPTAAGFGVVASLAEAAPLDSTTSDDRKISTSWSEFEIAGRYQYYLAGGHHVGLEVGFGGQTFDFTFGADSMDLEDELPEVAYRYLRFAADGRVMVAPRIAVFGGANYRQVRQVGELATRYAKTTVASFGLGLGVGYAVTPMIEARVAGDLTRYTHAFEPDTGANNFVADGGTDQFFGFLLGAAFRY